MAKAKKKAIKAAPKAAPKSDEGKTYAIVAYITWIGWIIALILNIKKKDQFVKFHIRQALIPAILGILSTPLIGFFGLGFILGVISIILAILGLINAAKGEKKELPVVGKLASEWFKGL